MIETKDMTVDDFMRIMSANADIYPEYDNLSLEAKRYVANINIMTGTAMSYFEDGELIGVGGIRYVGIGEGWMLTLPNIREERKFLLFRQAKKDFEGTRKTKNLWRIFAETRISRIFLRHLGFTESENTHVWTGL
jgi:hypothetical protein